VPNKLSEHEYLFALYLAVSGGVLRLKEMSREDAGVYECVAGNVAGFSVATARVRSV
jgi:hypothetical protein